jgi:hypothetical protein
MNSMNVTERTLSDRKGGHLARRRDSGRPSLVACDALKVTGDIRFTPGVICRGNVTFINPAPETRILPAGIYDNEAVRL